MKLNFYNILLSLGLSITASAAFSAAQDIQYPSSFEDYSETIIISDDDKTLIALGEPEPRNKIVKDSLANVLKAQSGRNIKVSESKTSAKPDTEATAKQNEEDDSILSFNFLYYIFQKYKLQDIVD